MYNQSLDASVENLLEVLESTHERGGVLWMGCQGGGVIAVPRAAEEGAISSHGIQTRLIYTPTGILISAVTAAAVVGEKHIHRDQPLFAHARKVIEIGLGACAPRSMSFDLAASSLREVTAPPVTISTAGDSQTPALPDAAPDPSPTPAPDLARIPPVSRGRFASAVMFEAASAQDDEAPTPGDVGKASEGSVREHATPAKPLGSSLLFPESSGAAAGAALGGASTSPTFPTREWEKLHDDIKELEMRG